MFYRHLIRMKLKQMCLWEFFGPVKWALQVVRNLTNWAINSSKPIIDGLSCKNCCSIWKKKWKNRRFAHSCHFFHNLWRYMLSISCNRFFGGTTVVPGYWMSLIFFFVDTPCKLATTWTNPAAHANITRGILELISDICTKVRTAQKNSSLS
jgi:hypothetical protein